MQERGQRSWRRAGYWVTLVLCGLAARAAAMPRQQPPLTEVTVIVTGAASNKPIFQARLTLKFRDPNSRRGKTISYSAKTNNHGEYKFTFIPMGPLLLVVTAPDHQTFGKQFQLTQPNQVIRVKLARPQPLR